MKYCKLTIFFLCNIHRSRSRGTNNENNKGKINDLVRDNTTSDVKHGVVGERCGGGRGGGRGEGVGAGAYLPCDHVPLDSVTKEDG